MSLSKKIPDSDLRIISQNIESLNEFLKVLSVRSGDPWNTLKSDEGRKFLSSFYKEVADFLINKDQTQAAKKLAAVYEALAEFVVENETIPFYSKGD